MYGKLARHVAILPLLFAWGCQPDVGDAVPDDGLAAADQSATDQSAAGDEDSAARTRPDAAGDGDVVSGTATVVAPVSDIRWSEGDLRRDAARREVLRSLLNSDGYLGEDAIRMAMLAEAQQWLELHPGDSAAIALAAMLALPRGVLTRSGSDLSQPVLVAMRGLDRAVSADVMQRLDAVEQLEELYGVLSKRGGEVAEAGEILARALRAVGRERDAEELAAHGRLGPRREFHWACAYQALGVSYTAPARDPDELPPHLRPASAPGTEAEVKLPAAMRHYNAGRLDRALEVIERGHALKPAPEFLVLKGFLSMARRDYEFAAQLFLEATEWPGGHTGAVIGSGHLALIEQDYVRAGALLEAALNSVGEAERARGSAAEYHDFLRRMGSLGLGWLHANQGQHDLALGHFERVLALRADDLLARLGRCNSLIGLMRMDEARAGLLEILEAHPDNPDAHASLASIQLSRGELGAAESSFKKAIAERPEGYTCPYEGLGLVYLRQGQTEAARKQFEKAIAINPEIEYRKFNGLARIYISEGRTDEAKKLLHKSIANYPYDDEAKEMLEELGP